MNKLKSFYRFIKPIFDTVIIVVAFTVLGVVMGKDEITNKDIVFTVYSSLVLVWWGIDVAVKEIKQKIEDIFEDEEEIEEENK